MEDKKAKRLALAKITDYAKFFGNHKPNIETRLISYKEAMNNLSIALYSHFGAFNDDNDYMNEDLENMNEAFERLENLKENI